MIEIQVLSSGSHGNCYRVSDGEISLLLDCGIPWKKIQQGLNFRTDIEAVLLSHSHKDHSKAVKDIAKASIDIYMLETTREQITATGHRIHIIEPLKQFTIGTWTILPFDTVHDVDSVGYLLVNQSGEKLLFATDTCYLKYKFVGLTHLLIECNFADDILKANVDAGVVAPELKNRIIQTHFSLANVKECLKVNDLSNVEGIWLIHLSDQNSNSNLFKTEIQKLTGKPTYIC
jgi:phosphoribosyl 1,2-cyclic phosphodiesterase